MSISMIARQTSTDSVDAITVPARGGLSSLRVKTVPVHRFRDICHEMDGLEGSAFQSPVWLNAWFDVFGAQPAIECFVQLVEDAQGEILLALPLIRRTMGSTTVIETPDLGVSDYAAPLVRRAALPHLPSGAAMWDLLMPAMPEADLLHIRRIVPVISGMVNPLYGHPAGRQNRLAGWVLPLNAGWETYLGSLSPKMREKLKKMGRKFNRVPNAERRVITDVAEGLSVLKELERLQSQRIETKGLGYHLDEPAICAFYRRLIETGLPDGSVQMTTLLVDGQVVAANFAAVAGQELVYLRVANEFGPWARHALGLLVTEFAIAEAQRKGVRVFDFGMGNYDYKRRFGAVETPLQDLVLPLTWRGWPAAILWYGRYWASQFSLLRRLFGKSRLAPSPCCGASNDD